MLDLKTKIINKTQKELRRRCKGKRSKFPERAFAVYVCHRYSRADHNEIAKYFSLAHRVSISHSLNRIRKEIVAGHWANELGKIEEQLYIKTSLLRYFFPDRSKKVLCRESWLICDSFCLNFESIWCDILG